MDRFSGALIGAGFGLAFVLANSGPPLHPTAALVLRSLAFAGLVTICVLVIAANRRLAGAAGHDPGNGPGHGSSSGPVRMFGPFYFVVVGLEAVLLLGGIQLLRYFDWPMQANVAWIAFAVGLHFFPLAWYWRMRAILVVAVYMTLLGAIGLVMAAAGHPDWVPFVSGVVTGIGMLAGTLAGVITAFRSSTGAGGTEPSAGATDPGNASPERPPGR